MSDYGAATQAVLGIARDVADDRALAELLDADAAGIMLADPHGQLQVMAATSENARLTELMQLQADEGPCLRCYRAARRSTWRT
jgi:hypothetical protein